MNRAIATSSEVLRTAHNKYMLGPDVKVKKVKDMNVAQLHAYLVEQNVTQDTIRLRE